jgi:hypothetical protein
LMIEIDEFDKTKFARWSWRDEAQKKKKKIFASYIFI